GEKRLKYMREAGSPDRRQTGSNAPPNTTTSPQTTHCAGEPVGTQAWASQEDELARSLEDCLSVFRSGLLHDIRIEGLVFWEPSKEDDLRPPPPLQRLAKANTQFLEYREWIKKMLIDCQNLDCGTFERCRSIRDQLLHDIQNEWIKLDDLQLRAWQMASQNDRSVPTPSGPGPTVSDFGSTSTRVIDTSPHFEMPLFSSDVQPVVVVAHILVAVMHIASGLSLRDCAQLLFTIQLLISLMVEDFRATDGQGSLCSPLLESLSAVQSARLVILTMDPTHTPKCARQNIHLLNESAVGASEKHGLFAVVNTIPLSVATFTTRSTIGWGRCYAVPGWRT
ncbi:hypothetical protein EDB86DRAFT_2839446, partial [Lactarius hatsudake]